MPAAPASQPAGAVERPAKIPCPSLLMPSLQRMPRSLCCCCWLVLDNPQIFEVNTVQVLALKLAESSGLLLKKKKNTTTQIEALARSSKSGDTNAWKSCGKRQLTHMKNLLWSMLFFMTRNSLWEIKCYWYHFLARMGENLRKQVRSWQMKALTEMQK